MWDALGGRKVAMLLCVCLELSLRSRESRVLYRVVKASDLLPGVHDLAAVSCDASGYRTSGKVSRDIAPRAKNCI